MNRDEVLDTAKDLINGDRQEIYGDSVNTHKNIGLAWSPIVGYTLTPLQVALCMVALKSVRALEAPDHKDSFVDMAGYAALAAEMPHKETGK